MGPQYAVQRAVDDTLRRYGLEKIGDGSAITGPSLLGQMGRMLLSPLRNHPSPGYGPARMNFRWQDKARDAIHTTANLARELAVGSPVDAWKAFRQDAQARGSHLKAYGKLLKDYYWAPHAPDSGALGRAGGNAMRALGLGLTGLDFYQAVTGDPTQRRGDLAAAATGALIGPVTGSMGWKLGPMAHVAITNGARSLGHRLDPATTPPTQLAQAAPTIGPHIRRAIRAHNMLAGDGDLNPSELLPDD